MKPTDSTPLINNSNETSNSNLYSYKRNAFIFGGSTIIAIVTTITLLSTGEIHYSDVHPSTKTRLFDGALFLSCLLAIAAVRSTLKFFAATKKLQSRTTDDIKDEVKFYKKLTLGLAGFTVISLIVTAALIGTKEIDYSDSNHTWKEKICSAALLVDFMAIVVTALFALELRATQKELQEKNNNPFVIL